MWLGAKKKMNTENAQIKEDMMAAEAALRKIKALGVAVRDKTAEVKKREFTIKMVGVKIGRAKKALGKTTCNKLPIHFEFIPNSFRLRSIAFRFEFAFRTAEGNNALPQRGKGKTRREKEEACLSARNRVPFGNETMPAHE